MADQGSSAVRGAPAVVASSRQVITVPAGPCAGRNTRDVASRLSVLKPATRVSSLLSPVGVFTAAVSQSPRTTSALTGVAQGAHHTLSLPGCAGTRGRCALGPDGRSGCGTPRRSMVRRRLASIVVVRDQVGSTGQCVFCGI